MAPRNSIKGKSRPQPAKARPTPDTSLPEGWRIAKVLARAGLCSRRDAERWIAQGRVALNGKVLTTPAITVKDSDTVTVDGQPLPDAAPARLWRYHKPKGLVTTHKDPEGRPTVFDRLARELPRVISIGRLDLNTEGLLLLTNDGALARLLELPATGWLRRYRVRAFGGIDQAALDRLKDGVSVDGVKYSGIEATLDRKQGDNVWLTLALREGKNREVKRVLDHLGLKVNRLIRLSYGPFQLGDLALGAVEEVKTRILKDQLGARLIADAGLHFPERQAQGQYRPAPTPEPDQSSSTAKPAKPVSPAKPAKPVKPVKPPRPARPIRGGKPARSGNSGKPSRRA